MNTRTIVFCCICAAVAALATIITAVKHHHETVPRTAPLDAGPDAAVPVAVPVAERAVHEDTVIGASAVPAPEIECWDAAGHKTDAWLRGSNELGRVVLMDSADMCMVIFSKPKTARPACEVQVLLPVDYQSVEIKTVETKQRLTLEVDGLEPGTELGYVCR
jgi:hypothetical protein